MYFDNNVWRAAHQVIVLRFDWCHLAVTRIMLEPGVFISVNPVVYWMEAKVKRKVKRKIWDGSDTESLTRLWSDCANHKLSKQHSHLQWRK